LREFLRRTRLEAPQPRKRDVTFSTKYVTKEDSL
jgi:hypothetical protein